MAQDCCNGLIFDDLICILIRVGNTTWLAWFKLSQVETFYLLDNLLVDRAKLLIMHFLQLSLKGSNKSSNFHHVRMNVHIQ